MKPVNLRLYTVVRILSRIRCPKGVLIPDIRKFPLIDPRRVASCHSFSLNEKLIISGSLDSCLSFWLYNDVGDIRTTRKEAKDFEQLFLQASNREHQEFDDLPTLKKYSKLGVSYSWTQQQTESPAEYAKGCWWTDHLTRKLPTWEYFVDVDYLTFNWRLAHYTSLNPREMSDKQADSYAVLRRTLAIMNPGEYADIFRD